jgi:hypothetical protein
MATFRFIGKTDNGPVRCYTGEMVSKGDAIELSPALAKKAMSNPNYEEAITIDHSPVEPKTVKKKLSRKKVSKQ